MEIALPKNFLGPEGLSAALLRAARTEGQPGDGELLRPVKVENRSLILDAVSLEELAAIVGDRINY